MAPLLDLQERATKPQGLVCAHLLSKARLPLPSRPRLPLPVCVDSRDDSGLLFYEASLNYSFRTNSKYVARICIVYRFLQ